MTTRSATCWKWKASTPTACGSFPTGRISHSNYAKALIREAALHGVCSLRGPAGTFSAIFGDVFAGSAFLALRKPGDGREGKRSTAQARLRPADQQQEGGGDAGLVRGCVEQGSDQSF